MSKEQPHLYFLSSWVITFFLLLSPLCAAAQTPENEDTLRKQLEKMKADIEKEEAKISVLRRSQKEVGAEITKIERIQSATADERTSLTKSINELESRSQQIVFDIAQTKAKAERVEGLLGQRVAAIYKSRRRKPALDYLFGATSATDLLKRALYLTRIAEYDIENLRQLNEQLRLIQEKQDELAAVKQEKARQLTDVSRVEKQLEEQRTRKNALLMQQKEKMQAGEKSLSALKISAASIEALLAKVMGGEGEKPQEIEGKKPEEVKVVTALSRIPNAVPQNAPYEGSGLELLKGKLPFPVSGQVIQLFGKQKHDEFADLLFNKGIEVTAPAGSSVRAVADGKVIFSKPLPGYGNVIILDHGARYYTLYGRLEAQSVSVGELVQAGDKIATLGVSDKRGKNFYFELRIRGKAADPGHYFRAMPVAKEAREDQA